MWTTKTLSSKVRCGKINAFGDRVLIERCLVLWIYCIEAIWTHQSVFQLAAKLGSISICGLHSFGRFLTRREKVWGAPTFPVYFPKPVGRLNPFSCPEKVKVLRISLTLSVCQHAVIGEVCRYISLLIQRHLFGVLLLQPRAVLTLE